MTRENNKVRLGVIGYGYMGSSHIKYILAGDVQETELTAVAEVSESGFEAARAAVPDNVRLFRSDEELIASGLCDAVLIALPHYDHPACAINAFEHGLHVLCESPAGVYTKQVREMNQTAAEHPELVFGIMLDQRANSVYKKMHGLVTGKTLGEIKRVNWIITDCYRPQSFYDSCTWQATWDGGGGGALLNQCPNSLDLLQWICGMPTAIRAFCHNGKWHDIEVEDDVTAYMEFANGATGVFVTSTADAPGTNRFEITLERGKLVCEDGKLTVYMLDVSEREFCMAAAGSFDAPPLKATDVVTDGSNPRHKAVLNAFNARILRGEPLIANGAEGINGLTISNAMHMSGWLSKTIRIPFNEDMFMGELNNRRKKSRANRISRAGLFDT